MESEIGEVSGRVVAIMRGAGFLTGVDLATDPKYEDKVLWDTEVERRVDMTFKFIDVLFPFEGDEDLLPFDRKEIVRQFFAHGLYHGVQYAKLIMKELGRN